MTTPNTLLLSAIDLRPDSPNTLYRQIYDGIRRAILNRQLPPGAKLPSTRDLADILGVSRNTVSEAFERLLAEGYVQAVVGSGTYVSERLPDDLLHPSQPPHPDLPAPSGPRRLSQRGRDLRDLPLPDLDLPYPPPVRRLFPVGIPALDEFPLDLWARLVNRHTRYAPPNQLNRIHDPAGALPLRQAIAGYLRAARAVQCEPEQIVITSGAQEAISVAALVTLDAGDSVWVEEPGYLKGTGAFFTLGIRDVPVPVDGEGLDVAAGMALAPQARAACVTPSHQFPLGITMSLSRRLQLLRWAEENGAWIFEDDYDSPYRYIGHPLSSLQGLDRYRRVIYVGTFNKLLFPSLGIGYLVVPPDLLDAIRKARFFTVSHPPPLAQAALAEFIGEGHFIRHVRRTRRLYHERRDAFLDALERELGGLARPGDSDSGMHMVVWLDAHLDDRAIAARAREEGFQFAPLSAFYQGAAPAPGMALGYAAATPDEIRDGVRRLARIVEQTRRRPSRQ